jgi:hypothetical protein
MKLLEVLISRAKSDQGFAEIVAGIFEGTYPSYAALNPDFIIKVVLQASSDLKEYISRTGSNTAQLKKDMNQFIRVVLRTARDISYNRKLHS